ncbi:DUF418 domain-containing protein [candidate division KSB1 bacterium]|nr:DUF418 domain-containing protein [candidate division KSB1 bacterium]
MANTNHHISSPTSQINPVKLSERLQSLDILRGLAILGILVINIEFFAQPLAKLINPALSNNFSGFNYYIWLIKEFVFSGKFWSIFAILFGAGAYLLITRAEEKGKAAGIADIYYRRLFWLLFFALVHAYLIWNGDILYDYAIVGLFLYPLRKLSVRTLFIAVLILLILYTLRPYIDYKNDIAMYNQVVELTEIKNTGKELTEEQQSILDKWEKKKSFNNPDHETLQKNIEIVSKGTYFEIIDFNKDWVQEMHTIWFYNKGFLRTLMKMILGMALIKSGILLANLKNKIYLLMIVFGYLIGFPLAIFRTQYLFAHNFSLLSRDFVFITWEAEVTFVALGHIGLICLFCKFNILNWLKKSLSAVGRMAFTNYIMQSLIGTFLFYSYGFGLFGTMDKAEQLWVVAAIWIFQLIASPIWLRYFRFGPLEWGWRSLTYWKRQPMIARN